MNPQREGIHWLRYPEAEVFVNDHLSQFVGRVAPVQALQADLIAHTGTRLVDWLDHPVLADRDVVRGQLADLGFEPEDVPAQPGDAVYGHPGAIVPRLVLWFGVDFPTSFLLRIPMPRGVCIKRWRGVYYHSGSQIGGNRDAFIAHALERLR